MGGHWLTHTPPMHKVELVQEARNDKALNFQDIHHGNCFHIGALPILDRNTCEAAAKRLKLTDTTASVTDDAKGIYGCYRLVWEGNEMLWINTNPKNKANGAMKANSTTGHVHSRY